MKLSMLKLQAFEKEKASKAVASGRRQRRLVQKSSAKNYPKLVTALSSFVKTLKMLPSPIQTSRDPFGCGSIRRRAFDQKN